MQNSLFVNNDKECVDQVFRIICHYFLPPCGTVTNSLLPSSICWEECSQVQSSCQETWDLAKSIFGSDPFIDCEDTADLLFPIPNCCTGAGIEMSTKGKFFPVSTHCKTFNFSVKERADESPGGGAIAGAVIGVLIFIVAVAIVVVLLIVIVARQLNRKKQLKDMQMDIFAM